MIDFISWNYAMFEICPHPHFIRRVLAYLHHMLVRIPYPPGHRSISHPHWSPCIDKHLDTSTAHLQQAPETSLQQLHHCWLFYKACSYNPRWQCQEGHRAGRGCWGSLVLTSSLAERSREFLRLWAKSTHFTPYFLTENDWSNSADMYILWSEQSLSSALSGCR